jgi:hypothetical protein
MSERKSGRRREFDEPIALPDRRKLVTLRDAGQLHHRYSEEGSRHTGMADRHDEPQEPYHSVGLGDSITSATRIGFSVHTWVVGGLRCAARLGRPS